MRQADLNWKVGLDQQQAREKIIFAHELERRKWALELHDGIIQSLANVYYRLQAYRKLLDKAPDKAKQELGEIEEIIMESIAEARGIIDDLRPSILDDIGLIPAIEKYVKKIKEKDNISVDSGVEKPIPRLSSEIELTIYRIIQEALSNIRKHAKATKVKVKITEHGQIQKKLLVEVTDNGCGFDVEAVDAEGDNWGLIGMRERAEIIGGFLQIESTIGQGTSIRFELPLP